MSVSLRGAAALLFGLSTALPAATLAGQGPSAAAARAEVAAPGTIRGRVTEKEGGGPIASAQVVVVGTRFGGLTNTNGEYVVRVATPGPVQVRASRIGYQPVTQSVTVPDGGTVTANFQLEHAIARLEEVVTTATGEQERKAVGNVIASIATDSLAITAPVKDVQDVLQARTAGVDVFQQSGQAGAGQSIRIRGLSSLSLTNDPLVIVDGARFDNTNITGSYAQVNTNHLSDLNPEEIESIDVIKGPSATALYGTSAANGVIVIKTKRGAAGGGAKWMVFGEQGTESQPNKFASNYLSWGHNLNAAGQVVGGNVQCRINYAAAKLCQIDSLTSNNPYTNRLTDPFSKSTPSSKYGAQVSGGSDLLRYFLSGTHAGETGPFTMPDTDIKRLTLLQGIRPVATQINPNQLRQNNLRGNFQVALSPTATLDISTGFSDMQLYTPFDGGYFAGLTFQLFTAPGCSTNCPSKTVTNGTQREFVGNVFQVQQYQSEQRFTGSTALNWAPINWLQVRSTVGVDESNVYADHLQLLGQGPNAAAAWGPTAIQNFSGIDENRTNTNKYSVDVGATATKNLSSAWIAKTTLGTQWYKDELYQDSGEGYGLGPGVSTPNSAAQRLASSVTTENATYGGFVQEDLAWRDRLFLSGGVRTDQNSALGRNAGSTIYPRGSVSYVMSDESWFKPVLSMDKLRLRAAVGQAGVQPSTIAALQYLTATTFPINGVEVPGLTLAAVGNLNLKAEVTTEYEVGADLGFLNDRINVELTDFRKLSHNALYNLTLPPSYGAGTSQWVNLAEVENRGQELSIDGSVIRSNMVSWDLRLTGTHLNNKLVTVGNVALPTAPGLRNVAGYPINGLWDRPILSYSDANHTGVLTESEISVASAQAFKGSSLPTLSTGIISTLGLINHALTVTTNFDYQGHYYSYWAYQNQRCVSTGNCQAVNDPKAPIDQQAAALMAASSSNRTIWGMFVPNDFVRFRELSVSYALPNKVTNKILGSHGVTFVVSGRNLAVWTKFPGLDPEANVTVGQGQEDFYAEPPIRYWNARFNVNF